MITVEVNQQLQSVTKNTTLDQLLNEMAISTNGIAVAINQDIILRQDWATKTLQNKDSILIITATQGG